ncbi:hypothetical protein Bca4012_072232 [Brassica carinata]
MNSIFRTSFYATFSKVVASSYTKSQKFGKLGSDLVTCSKSYFFVSIFAII